MRSLFLVLTVSCHLLSRQTPLHIKSAAAAYHAGLTVLDEKNSSAAIEMFRKAIGIEPTFVEAHESLIEAYLASNRRLEAAAAITRFLEIEPERSHYRLILGQILVENTDLPRALAQFSLVLKSDPFDADALFGFAATAKQLGMQDRAARAMELGKSHHPGDKRFR
jgi:tetratricopeptide (TPR) repeat protein